MGSTHSSTMNNNGNDASASGNGGGDEEAVMVAVADQPAAEEDQQQQDQQLTISAVDDGNQNETANGNNDDDDAEMVDAEPAEETEGENVPPSASSRYSLRKRSRQPLLSIQDIGNAATSTTTGGRSSRSSRSSRKKQQQQSYDPNAAGYVNAANLTDRQFEKLLQEYEEKGERQRLQKKQRLERGYADDDYPYEPPAEGCPAFDALPKEAIQLVFELLPGARSVFNLAYQSKYMLSFVEKRMDIVIRATVLEDAHLYSTPTRSILSGIVQLVRKRSIHVPSPLRLLKMVNAKYCERGANCFGFDLKKGLASKKNMSSGYHKPFGFAICSACAKDCCTKLPRQWSWNHWTRQERIDGKIVFYGWRGAFDPDKGSDLCIGPDGERIGPIINGRHLQQIANTHLSDVEKQKNSFAAFVNQEYGEEGSEMMESFEKECADLVQIYEEAEKEREEKKKAYWKKWTEDNKAKDDAVVAGKKAKLQPIIAALEEAVADAPLNEMALDFEWKDSRWDPIKFRYHFVKDSLGKLLSAPSSVSQKKIKSACANICRKLEILSTMSQAEGDDDDFFSFDFLTTAHQECSLPLRKKALQKISEYCKAKLTGGMKGIIGGEHWYNHSDANNTNDRFFDLLEGGPEKYLDVVLHILSARKALGDIISEVLVPTTTSSNSFNHRHLAKAVWTKVESEMEGEGFTQASFYEALSLCKTEFQTMKTNAKDYLDEDAVKGFRNSNAWDSHKNRDAVDQVWDPQDAVINVRSWQSVVIPANVQNLRPYRLLLDRDFENLLRIHRFYRDNLYRWRHSTFGAVSHLHQTIVTTNNNSSG